MGIEEEFICNRCGFGSDELDEGEIAENCFAQIGHELYCTKCVAEHMEGDWLPAKPDTSVPTLEGMDAVYVSGGWCTPNDQLYNLYSYPPLYFKQKRERGLEILDEVANQFGT